MDAIREAELVALKRQVAHQFAELELMRALSVIGVVFGLFFVGYLYGTSERKH